MFEIVEFLKLGLQFCLFISRLRLYGKPFVFAMVTDRYKHSVASFYWIFFAGVFRLADILKWKISWSNLFLTAESIGPELLLYLGF